MIKLLIVDDHQIIREGLELFFSKYAHDLQIKVIGSVATGMEAIAFIEKNLPDIVLLDYSLPDMNGNEVMRSMLQKFPDLKIVFLTASSSVQMAEELLNNGARGFVTKRLGTQELVNAINTVMRGEIYDDPRIMDLALVDSRVKASKSEPSLSHREKQILKLIAEGLTGQEIAEDLNISQKTVSTYKKRIREKLGVEKNVDLIRLAVQYPPDDLSEN